MDFICFCKREVMSRCTATSWEEQRMCHYYDKHTNAERCSNLDPDMSNHCWSPLAQAAGYCPPRPSQRKSAPTITNLDGVFDQYKTPSCQDCLYYSSCPALMAHNRALGTLTISQLQDMAARCSDFVNVNK